MNKANYIKNKRNLEMFRTLRRLKPYIINSNQDIVWKNMSKEDQEKELMKLIDDIYEKV